jgi:hypothetical protein
MRKRLVIVVASLTCLTGLLLLFLPRAAATSPITKENFHRIRTGMSQVEVEDILGPSGDYTTVAIEPVYVLYRGPKGHCRRDWLADQGRITINFVDNKVIEKNFLVPRPAHQNAFERILWDVLQP